MDPVGTSDQSAMADLKDVAMNKARKMVKTHPLINENIFFLNSRFNV